MAADRRRALNAQTISGITKRRRDRPDPAADSVARRLRWKTDA
jgi:hypothetical protein